MRSGNLPSKRPDIRSVLCFSGDFVRSPLAWPQVRARIELYLTRSTLQMRSDRRTAPIGDRLNIYLDRIQHVLWWQKVAVGVSLELPCLMRRRSHVKPRGG